MNARAAASHAANPCPSDDDDEDGGEPLLLPPRGCCSAERILEMGRVWPITPVDMTRVSDDGEGGEEGGEGEGGAT